MGVPAIMNNWFKLIDHLGRAICWVCGVLFARMFFPSIDVLSFLLLGLLCGDCVSFAFTLVFTYVRFHVMAKSDGEKYDQDQLATGGVKTITNQGWLDVSMSLMPEFAAGVFGAGMGLLAHCWFGWGIFATLVVCLGGGAVTTVLLSFALRVFARNKRQAFDLGGHDSCNNRPN
jgi:hypothetical protein